MAESFLTLTNKVLVKLNEVELTSSNFATASGFYAQAKDAVNHSVRDINQQQYNYPFNHVEEEETVTANVMRYDFPATLKTVAMDTFRIKKDTTLDVETRKLKVIDYEEYLNKYIEYEYDTSKSAKPQYVFRTPDLRYGLIPAPDKAYTIIYEYYQFPTDLELHDDVPTIPERFAHVILDGAMFYAYLFRENTQDAMVAKEKFNEGIENMRSLLVNRFEYVRSGMIINNTGNTSLGNARATDGAAFD